MTKVKNRKGGKIFTVWGMWTFGIRENLTEKMAFV